MRHTLPFRDERLFAAHFVIDLSRELYRSLFPLSQGDYASHLDALLVACCVTIGHAEGRPMNASKIAHYLSMARNTARRRIEDLIEAGAIVRQANAFMVSQERMRTVDTKTAARITRLFRAVAAAPGAIGPVDGDRPKWTP